MKTLLSALLFTCALFSARVIAQNTPAPCDPANLQATDVKYGCYNTPDCITGFMCFYIRVLTDVVYGTTCSEQPMYLCASPNAANTAHKGKSCIPLPGVRNVISRQKEKNKLAVRPV